MGLYLGIFTALLVLGLIYYFYRNWQAKRVLNIIPRWVVRKFGDGTKEVYFCVEIWNNSIVPTTVSSITFSTSKHAGEFFEIKETLGDHLIPLSVGPGQKTIAAFKNVEISRIALLHLNHVYVSLNNGYKQSVSETDINYFLRNYQAELDKSKSCNPHHRSNGECDD